MLPGGGGAAGMAVAGRAWADEVVQASKVQPPDYLSIADSGLPSYEAAIRLPLSPRILLESSSHTCLPGAAPPPHTPDIALDIPTLPTNLPPVYSADSRTEHYL